MKKTTSLLLSTALLATSAGALAATPGFYVGAQFGYNDIQLGYTPHYSNYNSLGAGLNVGVHFAVANRFQLGTELAYDYLGSFNSADDNAVAAFNWVVTATGNITRQLDVFIKAGITRQFIEDESYVADSDLAPIAMFGVAYNINRNWSFNLQYAHTFGRSVASIIEGESNSAITFNSYTLGAAYSFGGLG